MRRNAYKNVENLWSGICALFKDNKVFVSLTHSNILFNIYIRYGRQIVTRNQAKNHKNIFIANKIDKLCI